MSSETFLSELLYNATIFNQTRHIERSVFLFAFSASILAGFGFLNLHSLIKKYGKISKTILFSIFVVLILSELVFLQRIPQSIEIINTSTEKLSRIVLN